VKSKRGEQIAALLLFLLRPPRVIEKVTKRRHTSLTTARAFGAAMALG